MAHSAVGSMHVIIGPMFAGKTTALLHLVQEHEVRMAERSPACQSPGCVRSPRLRPQGNGKKVVVVKSDRDGRYSTREVVSHDGMRRVRPAASPSGATRP